MWSTGPEPAGVTPSWRSHLLPHQLPTSRLRFSRLSRTFTPPMTDTLVIITSGAASSASPRLTS